MRTSYTAFPCLTYYSPACLTITPGRLASIHAWRVENEKIPFHSEARVVPGVCAARTRILGNYKVSCWEKHRGVLRMCCRSPPSSHLHCCSVGLGTQHARTVMVMVMPHLSRTSRSKLDMTQPTSTETVPRVREHVHYRVSVVYSDLIAWVCSLFSIPPLWSRQVPTTRPSFRFETLHRHSTCLFRPVMMPFRDRMRCCNFLVYPTLSLNPHVPNLLTTMTKYHLRSTLSP